MFKEIVDIIKILFAGIAKPLHKLILGICTVAVLWILNDYFGFTFYINASQKIEQVNELNKLIKEYPYDYETTQFAKRLKEETINRDHVIHRLWWFLCNTDFISSHNNTTNKTKQIGTINESSIYSSFWFYFSSSGLLFLIFLISAPILLVTEKNKSLSERTASIIIADVFCFFSGVAMIFLCRLIPDFNWYFNYIINFAIQISYIWLLVVLAKKIKK